LAYEAEEYPAMNESTTGIDIVRLPTGQDVLTEFLRDGARRMLAQATEAEAAAWIEAHAHLKDEAEKKSADTMNYKLMIPHYPVRFDVGEPLFQAIPLASNVCADLEAASVTYQRLSDDPELQRTYQEWDLGRRQFHEQKDKGEVKPDAWQRDYFQGRDAIGRQAQTQHMIKVKPPEVQYRTKVQ
jgi:hypothetical protein